MNSKSSPDALLPDEYREIDASALLALQAMLPPGAFKRLLVASVDDITRTCAELEAAAAARDADRVRRAAHRLSGVLGQYACAAAAGEAGLLAVSEGDSAFASVSRLMDRSQVCASELRIRSQAP